MAANYTKNPDMARRIMNMHMDATPSDTLSSETATEIPEGKESITIGEFVAAIQDDPQLIARVVRALNKMPEREAPENEAPTPEAGVEEPAEMPVMA